MWVAPGLEPAGRAHMWGHSLATFGLNLRGSYTRASVPFALTLCSVAGDSSCLLAIFLIVAVFHCRSLSFALSPPLYILVVAVSHHPSHTSSSLVAVGYHWPSLSYFLFAAKLTETGFYKIYRVATNNYKPLSMFVTGFYKTINICYLTRGSRVIWMYP